MDDSSLRDYRSDLSRLRDEDKESADIEASMYHQEINTLKIEKLSQRVTIITIIIPCIIIAVLAFAYIDMKERVVDVDETKGNQVAQMAQKLEEKLNALDVRIAKAKFELDEKLPQVSQRSQALENQIAKIDSAKADLAALQAAVKKMDATVARLEKMDKQIKSNASQDKSTLAEIERINRDLLAAIKENNVRFKTQADKISQDMQLFREEFDARLAELSAWEEQIALLNKQTSLLDKQQKTLAADTRTALAADILVVRKSLENKIRDLEDRLSQKADLSTAKPSATVISPIVPAESDRPVPQLDTSMDNQADSKTDSGTSGISEESLTQ
ncbi:MAG TPA: hypothetical protein DHV36_24765 [Desulfobacteraceae bacterium]|nr:hypothetical protein [Desulfobacteraceae bacterium]|tara:strand:- start:41 stop:1030 length:990 start_codon:yes stop_codon:yes gene_type:complete